MKVRSPARRSGRWVLALGLAAGLAAPAAAEPPPRVVVVANERQPESVALARFYVQARGLPKESIIALPMPETEGITRAQFEGELQIPLVRRLLALGWLEGSAQPAAGAGGRTVVRLVGHSIDYLVTVRGVPLRVEHDPAALTEAEKRSVPGPLQINGAAVDSELALLPRGGFALAGLIRNPVFDQSAPLTIDRQTVLAVSRLDGPSWADARGLVESALAGERRGLAGRAYVDLGGPHADGDQWISACLPLLETLGFDTDVDRAGSTLAEWSRFDAPVLYFGWYAADVNGPFLVPGRRLVPGAIVFHLHSYSGLSLRSDRSGWAGPAAARGAAASVGNVAEPYLAPTHRPQILLRELAAGKRWGDAVLAAVPALSWMPMAVGDPLYRPFAPGAPVVAESPEPPLRPREVDAAVLRQARLEVRAGRVDEALAAVDARFRDTPSLPLALSRARLYAEQGRAEAAVRALAFLEATRFIDAEDADTVARLARFLAEHGSPERAARCWDLVVAVEALPVDARRAWVEEAVRFGDGAAAAGAGELRPRVDAWRRLQVQLTPPPPPAK